MTPIRQSLVFRVLALSFILLAVPLLVDSFVLMRERYQVLYKQSKLFMVGINQERSLALSQVFRVKRLAPMIITHFLDLENNFPQKEEPKLNKCLTDLSKILGTYYLALNYVDDEGYIVHTGNSGMMMPRSRDIMLPVFRFYKDNNFPNIPYTTLFFTYRETFPDYDYLVVYPVFSPKENRVVGLIHMHFHIGAQLEKLLDSVKTPYLINFALLSLERIFVAASDPSILFHTLAPVSERAMGYLPEEMRDKIITPPLPTLSLTGPPFLRFPWKKETRIGVDLPVENSDFSLLTYSSSKEIFEAPISDLRRTYWIYGLIFFIGGGTTYLATRVLARPYKKLTKVMEGIRSGQTDLRYEEDPMGFEINALGQTFNAMLDNVLEKEQHAEEERVKREVYANELRLGREAQMDLLPEKMPYYPSLLVVEHYLPAKEVGGDFYDVFVRDKEGSQEVVLVIADASGKGVQACFYSLDVRSYFRSFANYFDDPAAIMKESNRLFCQDTGDSGMFVTAAMGIYNGETKILRYFSCGHNPPLLLKSEGPVIRLNKLSMALGFKEDIPGETQTVQLDKYDMLFFYTDGITEAQNSEGEFYTEERLIQFLQENREKSVQEISDRLLEDVKKFAGRAPQYDDITLLAMRVV